MSFTLFFSELVCEAGFVSEWARGVRDSVNANTETNVTGIHVIFNKTIYPFYSMFGMFTWFSILLLFDDLEEAR